MTFLAAKTAGGCA
uniref:E. coli plasmid RP4 traF (5'end), traG, traH, traI, traJ, traK, traL and traM genes of the transfer region n=3 Tax=root TaxID=1 RepID=Q47607_ECOLX|nr:TraX [Integration vector pJK202]ACO50703.1 TraX [Cloning vector pDMK3]QCS90214.1 TraX [synthetic construct]CAA38337.1 unnamed protein product [Escherichia coli HB101]CAK12733.1 TraX protein [Pseudomonas aeruginosa]CAJ85727.1 TPA: TraX [Birmingham IncP-alpha plasmid]